jgi:hemerythrin-like domain-containing protein/rubrerythrin
MQMKTIAPPAALYAHAIAIEREAAERYAEFATRMGDLGNDEVASLFSALARLETQHLAKLERQAREIALPAIDAAEHAWLDSGAPETMARDLVYRMMGPRDALAIALAGEQRAHAFFLRVQRLARDPAWRALAQEMASEESHHIELIGRALARLPDSAPDWDALLAQNTAADQPIERWHADHVYFRQLLDVLEKQVDIFHAGGPPDYALMLDIIFYLRHFSDAIHHPREDVAFARLVAANPQMALPVARLAQEHRVIAHAGERLEHSLEQATGGSFIQRADIEALAATYLVYYRSHIAREEKDILPLAARVLAVEDWSTVEAAVPAAAEERFRGLRLQITPLG